MSVHVDAETQPGVDLARFPREHGLNANQVLNGRRCHRPGRMSARSRKPDNDLLPVLLAPTAQTPDKVQAEVDAIVQQRCLSWVINTYANYTTGCCAGSMEERSVRLG